MSQLFSHLRVSSEYSISQGLLTIDQIVENAENYSIPSVALTDQSNMFGLVKFFNKIYFCGQLSDPIHHPNFIEILKLCKDTDVVIHNSSSHKPRDYFIECFKANPNAHWVFGIDGLPEESHNYRIHQDGVKLFNIMLDAKKILQNPPTWQILTFKYNEDSIEKCKQIARENDIAIMITQSSRWDKDDEYRPRESLNAV